MNEKRQRLRVPFESSIEIDTGDGKKMFESLQDISMSGFFIKTADTFDSEKDYDFDLKLTCGEKEININGKCVPIRVEEGKVCQELGVGFKITEIDPEGSQELFKLVKYNTLD